MTRVFCVALIAGIAACSNPIGPVQVSIEIAGASGQEGLVKAAQITEKYFSEKRYGQVVFPDHKTLDEKQLSRALETAVVQPAFEEANLEGAIFVRCTINEPIRGAAELMGARCEEQIRIIANELNIPLAPVRS